MCFLVCVQDSHDKLLYNEYFFINQTIFVLNEVLGFHLTANLDVTGCVFHISFPYNLTKMYF